jgi:hypothetical protein
VQFKFTISTFDGTPDIVEFAFWRKLLIAGLSPEEADARVKSMRARLPAPKADDD